MDGLSKGAQWGYQLIILIALNIKLILNCGGCGRN